MNLKELALQLSAITVIANAAKEAKETAKNEADYNSSLTTESKKKGGMTKMASGGSASSRADGCCTKGKTRGKMV